jgi:peptidoglycan/xylan/chitin deacetylase (PgdA/CDA1 family)
MLSPKLFLKRSVKSVAALAQGFRKPLQNSVTILGYHRVVADIQKAEKNSIYGLVVSSETFREHCRILKKNFDVVSLREAAEYLEDGIYSRRPKAVITFDDGYLDNYEVAFPILRKLDLPATIFLPTTMIGKDEPLSHDKAFWLAKNALEKKIELKSIFLKANLSKETAHNSANVSDVLELTDKIVYLPVEQRDIIIDELEKILEITQYPAEYKLLNWEMVREMNKNGIYFGDHTATHPVLPLEDEKSFEIEIFESKKILEKELGNTAVSFAYPNGKYNEEIRKQIIKAGYRVAVTTDKHTNKFGEDLFALGRTCLCEESTRGVGGRFSPKVAKLRFGIGSGVNAFTFFKQYPIEKLWAFTSILSEINFLF